MSNAFKLVVGNASFCQAPSPEGLAYAADFMPTRLYVDGVAALGPDVVLAQEVLERHVPQIQKTLGLEYASFVPMHHMLEPRGVRNRLGIAVFSRWELTDELPRYYSAFADDAPNLWSQWKDLDFDGQRLSCVFQEVSVRFGDRDILWGGDMNLPRGSSAGWDLLAGYWRDNIPPDVRTSLDPELPLAVRKYGIERMIDAIWTRREQSMFTVSNVQLHAGLSDHLVLSANIAVG